MFKALGLATLLLTVPVQEQEPPKQFCLPMGQLDAVLAQSGYKMIVANMTSPHSVVGVYVNSGTKMILHTLSQDLITDCVLGQGPISGVGDGVEELVLLTYKKV